MARLGADNLLAMLDPRIYRTGLVVVALAVIVFAFSLNDQQGPLGTTLAPDAYNGQNAYAEMNVLSQRYPHRRAGSPGDSTLASYVAGALGSDGFNVSSSSYVAHTVDGPRTLENVIGVRPGLSDGTIVVLAHRDAAQAHAAAELSGTAVMLELARVLSGETHHRSIVLASTSGSAGGAGAAQLVRNLPGPVDAVIVLGDLAGTPVHSPIVVPWSNTRVAAPPVLRNTLAAALGAQAGLPARGNSVAGQFLHLALPMAVSEQGPFGAAGDPAVLLSLSGERAPAADEPTSQAQVTALGRTVLEAISALDGGPALPAPSSYLIYSGKLIPEWSIRLLVLALILPVLAATIDGVARARRRGHPTLPWVMWVLSAALPFALAALLVRGLDVVGLIDGAPPGPVGGATVRLHGGAIAILAILGCLILASFVALRPLVLRMAGARVRDIPRDIGGGGAAAALLLVLCLVSVAIWVANPFAAALVVPALHLWMWVVAPDFRLPRTLVLVLLLAGLALPVLAVVYYATTLGLTLAGAAWSAVLLLAGGGVGLTAALEWSVVLGCLASAVLIAWRAARQPRAEEMPVTVRGPVSYAGPGSLGGTGSALRR